MAAYERNSWNLGWVPSADFVNGPPNGLARMDNLQLDEVGALTLTPGIVDIYNTSGFPHSIFSKYYGATKLRYYATSTGEVFRNTSSIGTGGDPTVAAFGVARGYTLICSGDVRIKDDGANTYNIGIAAPTGPPGVDVNSQPRVDLTTGDTTVNASSPSFIAEFAPTVAIADSTVPGSSSSLSGDGIYFNIRIGDTSKLKGVKLQFYVDAAGASGADYYWHEWLNDGNSAFTLGINAWSTLFANRGDFQRVGTTPNLDWTTITDIRIFAEFTEAVSSNIVNEVRVLGGEQGPLFDTYDYVQVNVANDGKYLAKSGEGPIASEVYVAHGYTTVTPDTSGITPEITNIYIYRRSSRTLDPYSRPYGSIPKLERYYRVLDIQAPFGATDDKMSDEEALRQETLKLGLISVQDIPGLIVAIVSEVFSRTLYVTTNEIYVSEQENPDLVDPVNTFKLSGDDTTRNVWAKKTDTGRVLVGTTLDVFEVVGTLTEFPDGSLDLAIRPLGVSHPPITSEVATYQNTLFYLSSQGITALSGAVSEIISSQLNLLFQGAVRYGIAPVRVAPNDTIAAPIAVAKNKLFISLPLLDNTRRCFVYDFAQKYWHPYYTDPIALFTEEDGDLIAGYGGGSGDALREIYTYSNTAYPQTIELRTFHDDNNQPRNRKDLFTLKVTADTGNLPVNISIARNGSEQFVTVMNNVSFNGREEKFVTIAETIGISKTIALKITGTDLVKCKIYNFAVEYDARPEQLTYLRIPYTNVGTASRKRFVNFPFEIDTLGQTCEFFPLVDGNLISPTSTFSFGRKATHIHYFDTETAGTDIGGIICGFFEFYGVKYDEIASEKMPNPVTYLRIPQTDYGTPNRKRHSSYKFRINTRNSSVRFTPRLDGIDQPSMDFITTEPTVVEYFFTTDTIAINIGGTLESVSTPNKTPFEFYGVITPQDIEQLPPRLKEFRVPENNFKVAARKRIRTIPIIINTNNTPVTFTPIVDNVSFPSTVLNTPNKQTVYHFFETDSFGIDYSGELVGTQPFEFYGFGELVNVESLPTPKRFDQIGPIRFEKLAKFQAIRIRMIATGSSVPIKIINETEATIPEMMGSIGEWTGTLVTIPNIDNVYEILLPKTVNGTVFRVEIGPTASEFHRFDVNIKTVISGGEATPKWLKYA